MTDLTDHLAAIRARADAATEGPWEAGPREDGLAEVNTAPAHAPWMTDTTRPVVYEVVNQAFRADAEFIAAARADVPALLAAVEAVMELHLPLTRTAITGDCAAEDCDHEDQEDCQTAEVRFCAACDELAEQIDPYYMERSMTPVLYPCPTVRALTEHLPKEDA